MAEPLESSFQEGVLAPFLPPRPAGILVRRWQSPPKIVPIKRSVAAGAFLAIYVAAYLVAGFASIALVEHAWSAIFQ